MVRMLPAPDAHCNEVTLCCSYSTSATVCCMLVTAQARLHTCEPWYTSCQGRVAAAAAGPILGQAPPQMVSGAATSAPHHLAAVAVVQQRIHFIAAACNATKCCCGSHMSTMGRARAAAHLQLCPLAPLWGRDIRLEYFVVYRCARQEHYEANDLCHVCTT